MRVDSIYTILHRGTICCVKLDSDVEPVSGDYLECKGNLFPIKGVEWFAVLRRPKSGDTVGILIEATDAIEVGHNVNVHPTRFY